ncbi:phage neck terminator protein [Campylobacter mucosalis]|uniref:phage neck terminator protein n=1 Tax=Campylobacter mucosalis TaxID=202 RepID=UPI001470850F|nr:hypothetical protein [Campylobacter mucosalis]
MDTKTLQQLDLTNFKTQIAQVLGLPSERVVGSFSQVIDDDNPFIAVKVLNITQKGREYKFCSDETEIITTTKEANIEITAYGNNALAVIQKLNTLFYSSMMIKAFNTCGLGLVAVSQIRDLTLNFGAGVEQRASIDITCSYINRVKVSQNAINTAEVGVKVNR